MFSKKPPPEPSDKPLLTAPFQDLLITREGEAGTGDGDTGAGDGDGGIIDPDPGPTPDPVEPPADIPVSPTDLAALDLGSVARFGSAVLRVGAIDRTASTVRFLRDLGDPESFYTESELRVLILLRPIPGTADYEPWPRVVSLKPTPPPVTP
jgi:hypothetical protein